MRWMSFSGLAGTCAGPWITSALYAAIVGTTGVSMSYAEVQAQAARVSQFLANAWNDDFPEAFPDVSIEDMLGLALAHAVHRGWIEPDPAMSHYMRGAEALLESGGFDE